VGLGKAATVLDVQRFPSKHSAWSLRTGAGGRHRTVVELLLAAVAIALTVAVVISELTGGDSQSASTDPGQDEPGSATTGAAARPRPPMRRPPQPGNLLANPGFEVGLGQWRASRGAKLERISGGRGGSWVARLAASSSANPAIAVRDATRGKAGTAYSATVWIRASWPGTLVRITLVEEAGNRGYATDSAATVLYDTRWQSLEVVHATHQPGARLAIEVAAVGLPMNESVLVDDLELRAVKESFMS
jgi:hypothetical protein